MRFIDGMMRARFHAEPIIQATELLLQERTPRDVDAAHSRRESAKTAPSFANWSRQRRVASSRRTSPSRTPSCSPTAATP